MLPSSAILHDEITQTVDRVSGTGATPGPDFPLIFFPLVIDTSDRSRQVPNLLDLVGPELQGGFMDSPILVDLSSQ